MVISSLAIHQPGLALGNVLGSCISNILGAFSLGLIVQPSNVPLEFDPSARLYTAVLFATTTLFVSISWILAAAAGPDESSAAALSRRFIGALLVLAFALYAASIAYAIYRGIVTAPTRPDSSAGTSLLDGDRDEEDTNNEDEESHRPRQQGDHRSSSSTTSSTANHKAKLLDFPFRQTLAWNLLTLLVSLLALLLAGYILAHSVATLAIDLRLPPTSLGLTLLSLATTLPEKLVAIFASQRGHQGILVANTVGSNIFLLTLCAGVTFLGGGKGVALLGELTVFDLVVVWHASAAMMGVVWGAKIGGHDGIGAVGRKAIGWAMVGGYVVFLCAELGGWGR